MKTKKKSSKNKVIKSRSKEIKQQDNDDHTKDIVSVILLSDSAGYRMKSYGPISLVNINGKKLIDIQIQAINKIFPNNEIIICCGFEIDKTIKYLKHKYKNLNIRVVENQLYNNSNSCESIRIALNNTFNSKILICDGNLVFDSRVIKLINRTMPCAIIEKNPSKNMEIGINCDLHKNIQHFSFGAKHTWSEILFLNDDDLIEDFRKIINTLDNKNKFLFEALNELIAMKYHILTVENIYTVEKINNIKTYHKIKDAK